MKRVALLLVFQLAGAGFAQDYERLFTEAAAAVERGDYAAAIARYEAALQLRPAAPEARSNLAVAYYMSGRYQEAESLLIPLARSGPKRLPVELIIGLSRVRLSRYAEAVGPLEAALALQPGHRDASLGLGSALVGLNRLDEAADHYRRYLETNAKDAEAWYALGICYERLAEAASRRLSRLPDGRAWEKRFLGEHWLERGNLPLAREALSEAGAADPAQPGLRELQDLVAQRLQSKTPVEEWSPPASTPGPGNGAAAVYQTARALANRSREAFLRFIELSPDSWQAHLLLGDVARQRRDFAGAVRHYEAAAQAAPDPAAAWLGLGTVYWELADDEKAVSFLEKVSQRDPRNAQALFPLGNIAVKQRRDADAARILEQCLRAAPDHLGAQADLGKAYVHVERYAEAVPHLERARSIDTYGEIHFQLSRALARTGRVAEARRALEASQKIRSAQQERERRLRSLH